MKAKWYISSNVERIRKRGSYLEVYIGGLNKPFYIDSRDRSLLKKGQLRYNGNYITLDGENIHRLIKSGPIIHHLNMNKLDNRRDNLHVCRTKKEYAEFHFKRTGDISQFNVKVTDDMLDVLGYEDEEPYSIKDMQNPFL